MTASNCLFTATLSISKRKGDFMKNVPPFSRSLCIPLDRPPTLRCVCFVFGGARAKWKRISRCQNSKHFPLISFIFTSATTVTKFTSRIFQNAKMSSMHNVQYIVYTHTLALNILDIDSHVIYTNNSHFLLFQWTCIVFFWLTIKIYYFTRKNSTELWSKCMSNKCDTNFSF